MNVYRVSMINRRLNFRRVLDINAETHVEAVEKAKARLKGMGYDMVEYSVFRGTR